MSITYYPDNLASIMRAIFALLLQQVPPSITGNAAFMAVQPDVAKLRKKVEAAYAGAPVGMEITNIALVVLHKVEARVPVEDILALPCDGLLELAKKELIQREDAT